MLRKKIIYLATVLFCITGMISCDDILVTNSSTDISDEQVLTDVSGLNMLLEGTYTNLYFDTNNGDRLYRGVTGYQMYVDVSGSDILSTDNMGGNQYDVYIYKQERTAAGNHASYIWTSMYNNINSVNIIIDNIEAATGDENTKKEVLGQALAIRGLCYFHLIQNYQQTYAIAKDKAGVILRLSTEDAYGGTRATVSQCYNQIVTDLTEARSLLDGYSRSHKRYINKYVISGFLARVYSVMNEWEKAESAADEAYNAFSSLMSREEYRSGFNELDYNEVMWGIDQSNENNFGDTGQFSFWYNYDGETYPFYNFKSFFANDKYVELFETTEDRYQFRHRTEPDVADKWAYDKIKDPGNGLQQSRGSIILMRGAEMLLIRAEARANQASKVSQALADLQTLQQARGVQNITSTTDQSQLLENIYVERRKELLGEGITGMYDLLRLQRPLVREGDHFEAGKSSSTFPIPSNDYRFICQIPTREFELNDDLKESDQNPFSGQ